MGNPNQLSFLPDDYLERKARRRANVLCAVLAVVVLGVIVSAFQYMDKITKAAEQHFAEVDQKYADAARRIEKVNQMRAQQQQVVRRAELAASLVERLPRSNVLAEFTNSLPPGLSLVKLDMESKERAGPVSQPLTAFEQKRAALEGRSNAASLAPKLHDVYVKIEGIAPTDTQVGDFISKLQNSSLFREVNLIVTEEMVMRNEQGQSSQNAEKVRRFQIELMLNPNAEVTNPVNPNTKTTVEVAGGGTSALEDGSTPAPEGEATATVEGKELGAE